MAPSNQSAPPCKDWAEAMFNAQGREIKEMKERIDRWDRWWKVAMLAILGGIITVVGFMWSVNGRANEVEKGVFDVQQSVEKVTDTVGTVADEQKKLQTVLDKQDKRDIERQEVLHYDLKKAIKDALREESTGRRRRTVSH